ncbi:MAG: hypothetical protein JNL19_10785 [Burkholderiales bacterium]|nr:hypothetical protein [Burkholderiales bacterium]
MQPGDRVRKSLAGRAALADRSQQLSAPLRTLLLMIYGDKTAAEYSEIAAKLPAGREGFKQLIDQGLVEVVPGDALLAPAPPPAGSEPLQAPLADVEAVEATHTIDEAKLQRALYPEFVKCVAAIGWRGVFLQQKVERAMSGKELLLLRGELETALAKAKGEPARQEFSQRIDFLLSQ